MTDSQESSPAQQLPLLRPPDIGVADLSLDQKLALLSGASMWTTAELFVVDGRRLPSLVLSDGPHGIRKPLGEFNLTRSHPATCFPTASAVACSWDEGLANQIGAALSREAGMLGVHVVLGPGANLKRHPCGGRNFEYFSEDPLLSARMAAGLVGGIQASGTTAACLKHWAVNNQESHRFVVDAVVDDRTLHELYLSRNFGEAIKRAPPAAVMCAYNQVNGTFCSEHPGLLRDVLREECNFDGILMTDWGATNDRVAALRAGMDLEMPGSYGCHDRSLRRALREDPSLEACLDASVSRMLKFVRTYARDEPEATTPAEKQAVLEEHYQLALEAALESCVLLQNKGGLLPLSPHQDPGSKHRIGLVGAFGKTQPRYQGMGSSKVTSHRVSSVYDGLLQHVPEETIAYAEGYHCDDDDLVRTDETLLEEALVVARSSEVVVLCVGLPEIMESEGFDRDHMSLPAQHVALVERICACHDHVVVVLSNGGAVELPWADQPAAILEAYLSGEAGGDAVADLLFGVRSPSGKLAESFPHRQADLLADAHFPGSQHTVHYREGLLVGYRCLDTYQKPVCFPFGHGLSYTTFGYTDLSIRREANTTLVSCKVTNTGAREGKEVVQLYVHAKDSAVFRPEQELQDFCKVALPPGETTTVEFALDDRSAFGFWDIGKGGWVVEPGIFEIRVASSSRDVRLQETVSIDEGEAPSRLAQASYPPLREGCSEASLVDDRSFADRFGDARDTILSDLRKDNERDDHRGFFHRNSLLKEVAQTRWLGKILHAVVYKTASMDIQPGPSQKREQRMVKANVDNLPLRALVLFSNGGMTFPLLDFLIHLLNLRFLDAFRSIFRRG